MKKIQFLFISLILVSLIACVKEEPLQPAGSNELFLKAGSCTASVINYDQTDTVFIPITIADCSIEPIVVTLYVIHTAGHSNVSASCRFNDKSTLEIHVTGVGLFTGAMYDSYSVLEHHAVGTMTTGPQIQVLRDNLASTFINLTTGETLTTYQNVHQTINANGVVVVDNVEFQPCE